MYIFYMLLVRLLVGRRTEHCLISITEILKRVVTGLFYCGCAQCKCVFFDSLLSEFVKFLCLLRLICIARFFRFISIRFRGTKYKTFREHFALILALKAVTPGPAVTWIVCQQKRIDSYHGYHIICPGTFFFGDALALLQESYTLL